ncbi:MAG: chromosome segregation protein SMC [Verrucomicrobiota bacterium]
MYLKSIEAVGFKSFADPTVLEFDRGVTAVVGPNGCGKSNVLDAIRWVLGEQSAKALRGGSMQDVIFSGSDSRKPLGMAEVSLNFAECEDALGTEYHEVRISRRVFRDGHGEYEINKTPCRLRDIHRLFMDTGIGRSAYSIMEQGRIDQILSSKPEERRAVFEEAAGITRFKAQKREALRRLDATEANLLRVSDIVKEVSRQIGSLQRQANKARRYKEAFERLKLLDTHLAAHEYDQMHETLQMSEQRVTELQTEFELLQSGLDEKERLLKDKRRELEELNMRLQQLEQEKSTMENRISSSRQTIEYNRNRIEELEALKERNRAAIVSTDEKLGIQREQEELTGKELALIEADLEKISGELETVIAALDEVKARISDNQQQRNDLNNRIGAIDEQINRARQEKATIEARQTAHSERTEQLRQEMPEVEAQQVEVNRIVAAAESELVQSSEALTVLEQRTIEAEDAVVTRLEAAAAAAEQARLASSRQQERELRRNTLKEVLNSYQGFSRGTRELLKSQSGAGIAGALIDRLHVNPGYGEAIKVCLGAAWEAILVDDPAQIESILESLDGEGAIFAYNTPQPRSWLKVFKRKPAQSAIQYVKPDASVAGLVKQLLHSFLIAEDAREAEKLRRQYPSYHVVSKQGDAWYQEGWELRGDQSAGESVLDYEGELTQLNAELPGLADAVRQAQQTAAAAAADVEQAREQVQTLQNERKAAESAQRDKELKLKGLVHDRKTLKKTLERLQGDLEKIRQGTQDHTPIGKTLEEWDAEIDARTAEKQEAASRLESLQAELHRLSDTLDQRNQAVTDVRVREAGVRQRLKGAQQQHQSIVARIHELTENHKQAEAEIADYDHKITQSGQSVAEAQQSISQTESELEVMTRRFEEHRKLRAQLGEDLETLDESASGERRQASELQGRFGKEEVHVAQARMKLEALVDRVKKSYQLDLHQWRPGDEAPRTNEELGELELAPVEGVLETSPGQLESWIVEDSLFRDPRQDELLGAEETDWDLVREKVAEINEKIDRMGPVNVEAITEYEELEDRQHFLQQQQEDLMTSRDQLHEAIKRINQTTRVMFAETFEKIRLNFRDMFQELFGGGKAELNLEDASDPLECGIEIVARPPGKQLQSITLLSGGEKTMTAVSLLFAIYMVKPSPFCFLDEMDAPLDESNINRFIRILQRFVKQSQFCVITHNKRTISAADVLYGVTMQEQGVSRLVSMRMNRQDEDPLFNTDEEPPNIADAVRSSHVVTEGAAE